MGARKVVVVSLSPLGCLPFQLFKMGSLDGECIAEVNDLAIEYNAILADSLDGLRRHLPGAKLVYNDAYLAFSNITNHAASFGIVLMCLQMIFEMHVMKNERRNRLLILCSRQSTSASHKPVEISGTVLLTFVNEQ
jgi:hypothetical protein